MGKKQQPRVLHSLMSHSPQSKRAIFLRGTSPSKKPWLRQRVMQPTTPSGTLTAIPCILTLAEETAAEATPVGLNSLKKHQ